MAPPQKHKIAIVETAMNLFRKNGYAATGLNAIVEASGAPKGSVYHYFPKGKASIAEAAVLLAGERTAATLDALCTKTGSTGEAITGHAKLLVQWMKKSGFRDGCPITTTLLELAPADRAVTAAGRNAYTQRIDRLARRLVEDGFDPSRARNLATLCTSALQGALIQSRIERSGRALLVTAQELAALLDNETDDHNAIAGP
ncbi:TetR/AcrR family transcriptional regulator [Parasphingopyxis lamellibrachiae]|uniref:TetR family transcriptional regulator n=1 Tax=Parasphingopyxis lamellibrachiae TaxID=680125 RepID=A0A3D9FHN3_9SPHN|nr:TetR/AcrR family transcriptional regulator [Parasphingopyxis lamellibrachiae]RED16596.1 TetR family transcriptional regulator [Parasphingopyxis lamellibrachiae]